MGTNRNDERSREKSLIFIALFTMHWNRATLQKQKKRRPSSSKADSRYMVVQFACAGVLVLFAAITVLLPMSVNETAR